MLPARVGGDLDDGSDGVAGGSAEPGREEDDVRAGADLRGDALHVAARGTEEIEAGAGGVFGVVENGADWRELPPLRAPPAAFMASVSRPSWMLPGEGFISKPEKHGFRASGVVAHELDEAVGAGGVGAAVDEVLLHAAELRELGQDGAAAEGGEEVRDVADGGVGGDAGEAIRAAALECDGKVARAGRAARVAGWLRRGRRKVASMAWESIGDSRPDCC